MSTAMMSAPSRARSTACARPCPRAAPVMKATLFASRPVMSAPYRKGHCNGNDTNVASVGEKTWSLLALCRLDQIAADDQPLDLAGALIQAKQADVTVDALDRNLAHVTAAALNLHREIGDLACHFGAEHLRRGRRDPAVLVVQPRPGGVTDQSTACHHPGLLVGEHRLHQLEVADRCATLRGGRRVRDGFVQRPLRGSHRDC